MRLLAFLFAILATTAHAQEFSAPGWSWIEINRTTSIDEALRQAQGLKLEFPQVVVMQSGPVYAVAVAIVRDTIAGREADALLREGRVSQATLTKGESYSRLYYGINPFTPGVQYSLAFPRADPAPPSAPYLQMASRISLSQAMDLATSLREQDLPAWIVLFRNGWFAVVLPPSGGNASQINILKREKRIPSDSILVAGQNYVETVWTQAAAPDPRLSALFPELRFKTAREALSAGDGSSALRILRNQHRRSSSADYALGADILFRGLGGVRPDAAAAVAWLTVCADRGDQTCMVRLGQVFQNGEGAPKDSRRAVDLYRTAAATGDALARYRLASMLIVGDGTLQDFEEAMRLMKLAAVAGVPEAQSAMGLAYKTGFMTAKDPSRAYFWLSLASAGLAPGAARESALKDRNEVAATLDDRTLTEVQRAARNWTAGEGEPDFANGDRGRDSVAKVEAKPSKPEDKEQGRTTGSGFFVSNEGHVVTNAHVIDGCKRFSVASPGAGEKPATLLVKDEKNDLAVLSTGIRPAAVPGLRIGAKLGESVAVFGFPFRGLLSSNGNFTLGNIVALAGLGDDARHFQI